MHQLQIFDVANMTLNTNRDITILAKNSEFKALSAQARYSKNRPGMLRHITTENGFCCIA